MELRKYRLPIAFVLLAALVVVTIVVVRGQNDEPAEAEDGEEGEEGEEAESDLPYQLPEIAENEVTQLEIRRPPAEGEEREPPVKLTKRNGHWRVTAPIDAEADESAITTALSKLAGLSVQGVAATRAANHNRLEVDDERGIFVTASRDGERIATLIIGAYRGGNTMVRLQGEDEVLSVEGSIKYAFNKPLKDWRNRAMTDDPPEHVQAVTFESEHGTFRFERVGDDWQHRPGEGQEPIERFAPSKVQSVVSSLARMRAVNFAAADVDAAEAGLEPPAATVRVEVVTPPETPEGDDEPVEDQPAPEGERHVRVIQLGRVTPANDREYYCRVEGNPVIYVISKFLADRMGPEADAFQAAEPGAEGEGAGGEAPPMPQMPMMPPGGGGGPGGGQIPPEVMEQLRRQIEQQQGAGGGGADPHGH